MEVLGWGYCSLPVGTSTVCGTHPFFVVRVFSGLQPDFCGDKASGSWGPVIALSTLNLRVRKTLLKMETLPAVFLSVRSGDWMVSIALKDAYLQVPIHPDSRK